ncbi:class I SAM-dependent methyltransferase [Longispora sp. K20-0274]|uniref:class I SAM-dependent methyltransferase n=1 Tax=Longispora sp. K20-0274 TaxID=3088255 RepID=UPI00399BEE61
MTQDVNYDDGLYVGYDDGQSLPPATTEQLLAEFTSHAPAHRPLTALDLGSGTGRFSAGLADRFGGTVYAVEPSVQMRALAVARRPHPRVHHLAGSAERIPLPAASCDVVLLFLVYHHVADRAGALAEIARVLRPGGRVLLCGNFAGRPSPRAWSPYFPGRTRSRRAGCRRWRRPRRPRCGPGCAWWGCARSPWRSRRTCRPTSTGSGTGRCRRSGTSPRWS